MLFLIAAISLGFLGSFHCIGMCGPIALALPVINNSVTFRVISILTYNIGRALTYSIFGSLFGLMGKGFAVFGLQQFLSIALGSIILLSILIPNSFLSRFSITKTAYKLFSNLKSQLSLLFNRKNLLSLFSIGILNGLLPCGLVYMAVAGAMATGSAIKGAEFMMAFGLGTIPMMFSLSWFSNMITLKFRSGINKAMPYVISVMAIMMILRGLNLGIPYLSPQFEKESNSIGCCEKTEACEKTGPTLNCCHKK